MITRINNLADSLAGIVCELWDRYCEQRDIAARRHKMVWMLEENGGVK